MDALTLANVIGVSAVSSVSHCVGMCGGFVVAYSHKIARKTKSQMLVLSLVYHFARICAYVSLGVAFALFGTGVILSLNSKGYIYFFTGVLLALIGVAVLSRGRLLEFIENDKFMRILSPFFRIASRQDGPRGFAFLGFLNGLLPCGVVYYFLALSFGRANLADGAIIMLVFGLFTLPAMLGMSVLARFLSVKFRQKMNLASGILMIGYGIYLAFIGFSAIK